MESSRGVDFDPVTFIKTPVVILRLICILFSIIVFGCISAGSYDVNANCLYNEEMGACHYGVGIGVIAFLGCIVFLAIDSQFDTIVNPEMKKYIVMADLFFSALWTFLWFVGFCYLADMWRKTPNTDYFPTHNVNNSQAAIAFSFFSIITWAGLSVMALNKYRQGLSEFDYSKNELPGDSYSSPYASFPAPSGGSDPYQAKPFQDESVPEGDPPGDGAGEYRPPAY